MLTGAKEERTVEMTKTFNHAERLSERDSGSRVCDSLVLREMNRKREVRSVFPRTESQYE